MPSCRPTHTHTHPPCHLAARHRSESCPPAPASRCTATLHFRCPAAVLMRKPAPERKPELKPGPDPPYGNAPPDRTFRRASTPVNNSRRSPPPTHTSAPPPDTSFPGSSPPDTHIRPTARHLVPRLLATRHRPPTPFRPETRIHAGKQPRHLTSRHTVPQQYAAEQKIPPRILAGKRRPAPPPDSSPPNSPQRIPVGKQPPPLSSPDTHPHTQPPRNTHQSRDAHPTQDHPPPPPRRSAATCRRPPPHRSAPPDARAHKKAKHPCGCFASLWKRGVRYSPRAKRL